MKDPRTVARDIPGILDALFPQLAPGVVRHLNKTGQGIDGCKPVSEELITRSKLQPAMLFELAFAVGEQFVAGNEDVDWASALATSVKRQRRHFDAQLPTDLTDEDRAVARLVGMNLSYMLNRVTTGPIVSSPPIAGFQWLSSGVGDFSVGSVLIEVKCIRKRFGASDYRQILMYWLLSFAASIEGLGEEWSTGVLLNPRLNLVVEVNFDELIATVGAGRSKVDVLELFSWMIGDHSGRAINHV